MYKEKAAGNLSSRYGCIAEHRIDGLKLLTMDDSNPPSTSTMELISAWLYPLDCCCRVFEVDTGRPGSLPKYLVPRTRRDIGEEFLSSGLVRLYLSSTCIRGLGRNKGPYTHLPKCSQKCHFLIPQGFSSPRVRPSPRNFSIPFFFSR